jgi:3-phosphoshikimate 1-carboxyvinyltransferase
MKRIGEPLRLMGAKIEGDTPPLSIGGGQLKGIDYVSPVASAQIKSCVLLAGLRAEGKTTVREPSPSRDHTERMLRATGVAVDSTNGVSVCGGSVPSGFQFNVPADISSAAFFLVAAAIRPGSRLRIEDLSVNPTRTGILDVLTQAAVPYHLFAERDELGEPVAEMEIHGPKQLQPFEISGAMVPRLIDEIPVLAILATQCLGTSVIRDARELRVKESDRIETVAAGLRAMGASVETFEDGFAITGPTRLQAARIEADGDHRIAMAFAIAGLIAEGTTKLDGAEAIATSYPAFMEDLQRLSLF